jgi:hypothetical protein
VARYAIILSVDPDLFDNVRTTLSADSRFIDTGDTLHCDGSVAPLTNIYPVEMTRSDWDAWDSDTIQMPDPRTMSALLFECRSPAWVAEVGRLLAQALDTPIWIVDSDEAAWPADQVDPDRIRLD